MPSTSPGDPEWLVAKKCDHNRIARFQLRRMHVRRGLPDDKHPAGWSLKQEWFATLVANELQCTFVT
jgi:hypothetical protein